jgi:tRNA (adenine57-N1/adenine58-N1)-methyltransferase catalytic subunit
MTGNLAEGDLVQFIDTKGRRYQATLQIGKQFHSHSGYIDHEDIIGLPEASTVRTTRNQSFVVVRPTLSDFIFKMPRGAQVIYPKDIGPILLLADISPGSRVLESGVGSGALSMAMLRAGAHIIGYELREDFADRAQQNVSRFLGESAMDRYQVELRNCYDGIDETGLDRVVLDLPEPWQVVKHAERALRPGGILIAYTPSVVQVMQLRETLAGSRFFDPETREVLHRTWHVEGQAVRPDHRMVAHTGFLTHARLGA